MKTIIVAAHNKESTIDYDGHLTQMLFTSGCNFRCSFCHNCALWEQREDTMTFPQLDTLLEKAQDNWIDAVCITGGEPTIHRRLPELIAYIKDKGFLVKLDTNGSNPEMVSGLLSQVDYFAMDFKISLERYQEITNVNVDINRIKDSLKILMDSATDYEIRTTIIPGKHKEEEMEKICRQLRGIKRYIIQAFVPKEELLDNDYIRVKRTDTDHLDRIYQICRTHLPGTEIKKR